MPIGQGQKGAKGPVSKRKNQKETKNWTMDSLFSAH
jgi:hypothetical protein